LVQKESKISRAEAITERREEEVKEKHLRIETAFKKMDSDALERKKKLLVQEKELNDQVSNLEKHKDDLGMDCGFL